MKHGTPPDWNLAVKAAGLQLHIFHYDIMDLSQGSAVFKDFPGSICMEMDLDQIFVADRKQAVAFYILGNVFMDRIFREVFSFNQQLGIKFVCNHSNSPVLFFIIRVADKAAQPQNGCPICLTL
jgi:hypothetical protein